VNEEGCRCQKRGFWSQRTIKERQAADALIRAADDTPLFDGGRLDPAGYLLAMGPECYVSPAEADARGSVKRLERDEAFLIPAGQFAFLLTEEMVKVPADALAFIALRTKQKFRGLVNVSGFHADPGYHGRLIFSVFNAGPGDVHLRRGERLFMIMFADLDAPADPPRESKRPENMNIGSDLVMPIAGQIQSLAGLRANMDEVESQLKERLNGVDREVAILRWAAAIIVGLLTAILVRTISPESKSASPPTEPASVAR
jgi:dCTP deaminase